MKKVTVAHGDGIGPEIMDATLRIIKASGANVEFDEIKIGEKVYLDGNTSGIATEAWNSIRENKVFSESANHNTTRRRLQKFKCYHA